MSIVEGSAPALTKAASAAALVAKAVQDPQLCFFTGVIQPELENILSQRIHTILVESIVYQKDCLLEMGL